MAVHAQGNSSQRIKRTDSEKVLERFLSYAKTNSQSIEVHRPDSFPMTEGQKQIARFIYDEIKSFGGKNVTVKLSEDYYIYVKIPSNQKKAVPSLLFMAHMDVSPDVSNTRPVEPIVHRNYDGNDIHLPAGLILSPNRPEGKRLKNLKGKTIITSTGHTSLGADDKSGCCILVTMMEELIKNPSFKHGDVYVMLSQNEDVGKAALRFNPAYFDKIPEVVVDVDGDNPYAFSTENFTAIGQTYYFKGNQAHPSHAQELKLADALTAATYFIGNLPPEVHPCASSGKTGYIHCVALEHPKDATGTPIKSDYIASVRIRYFDRAEGESHKRTLAETLEKTRKTFPYVQAKLQNETKQYDNIAYTMYPGTPEIIQKAAIREGLEMKPSSERGGTTAAMLTGKLPGGPCIYSAQQAEHSCYEWTCLEDMIQMTKVVENIIEEISRQ